MVNPLVPVLYHAGRSTVESFGSYFHALINWNYSTADIIVAHCLDPEVSGRLWDEPLTRLLLADRFVEFGAVDELIIVSAKGANSRVVRWCPDCAVRHPGRHLVRWEDGSDRCEEHGRKLTTGCQCCGWQTQDVLHWLRVGRCPHCKASFGTSDG